MVIYLPFLYYFYVVVLGWHITLYVFAAICGILNYSFFQNTVQLFDENCILFPRKLDFHIIRLPNATEYAHVNDNNTMLTNVSDIQIIDNLDNNNETETKLNKSNSRNRRNLDDMTENDIITNFTLSNSKLTFLIIYYSSHVLTTHRDNANIRVVCMYVAK